MLALLYQQECLYQTTCTKEAWPGSTLFVNMNPLFKAQLVYIMDGFSYSERHTVKDTSK